MASRKCFALILFFAITGFCHAENNLRRNVLTNRDVVTLAKAGFDEEFLINVILSSRKQFDTSVDALAALAEQGITQRIVEVMMSPEPGLATRVSAPAPPIAGPSRQERQGPYYESRSLLWGMWRKSIGIGAQAQEKPVAPHLGPAYEGVLVPGKLLPIGSQPQNAPIVTHAVAAR